MRGVIAGLAMLMAVATPVWAQDFSAAPPAARELRDMCGEDRGRLWGVSLCGPLLVVDPASRSVWASDQDREGLLTRAGDGWMGILPDGVAVANHALDWAGVRWIMVLAPLPTDAAERRVLIAHEAWHRIQPQLRIEAHSPVAAHLETERGRILLRLEMRALATALRSRGAARRSAAQDALILRAARLRLAPDAFANEAALDRNEGLAAYTGVRLGAADQTETYAARQLDYYEVQPALSRSYAYGTGPAYGVLLDDYRSTWRSELGPHAPADLLASLLNAPVTDADRLRRAEERYGLAAVAAEERDRALAQLARLEQLRRQYAEAPRLELPLQQVQFEFNPNDVTPVEGLGSFYGTLTLRDAWGELTAGEGVLIDQNFSRLVAAAPSADGLSGPGWRLRLSPGWRVLPPDEAGVARVAFVPGSDAGPVPLETSQD